MRWILVFLCMATTAMAHPTARVDYAVIDGVPELQTTGAAQIDTPFAIASIGKTFTSVAILKAHEAGALNVSDPASNWLPDDIVSGFGGIQGITLYHLLTMTSGIPDYYDDAYVNDFLNDPGQVGNAAAAVAYAYTDDLNFRPGTEYEYSNTNYVLLGIVLGIVLEQIYDQTYADVITSQIFTPLGMNNSMIFGIGTLPDAFPKGHQGWVHIRDYYRNGGFGDGGALSTAQDMERFYRALFQDRTVLGGTDMKLLLTPGVDGGSYGAGVLLYKGLVGHSGGDLGFSSLALFDRKTGNFAISLVGADDADTGWALDILGR